MTGYTLLETLIIVTIISLFSTLLIVAWPATRQQQAALLTEHTIQSLLRQAQQQAFHEERSEECLQRVIETEVRRCSDIGLAFQGSHVIMFANTHGLNCRDAFSCQYDSQDYELTRHTLPLSATSASIQSFIFHGNPPRITLFGPDGLPVPPTGRHLTLTIGRGTYTFNVFPYGQVERVN